MGEHVREVGPRLYCRECFVGWREDAVECWQCGCPFAITKPQGRAMSADDGILESRVPELNPWAGMAVLALHNHTADAACDEHCNVYQR